MNSNLFGGLVVHAMIGFSPRSLLVPNLRGLRREEGPHNLHACIRCRLDPSLGTLCLRLASKEEDFWTYIMFSVVPSLSRYHV